MDKVEKYLNEQRMGDLRRDFIKFDQTWTSKARGELNHLGYKKESEQVEDYMEKIDRIIGRVTRSIKWVN